METVIRRMRIVNTNENCPPIDVFQLHYLGWPDFGVPTCSHSIRELAQCANEIRAKMNPNAPCIVHCSAGVGRTGTFMGIVCVLENPSFKEAVEFFKNLRNSIEETNLEEKIASFISTHFRVSDIVLSLRRQRNCGTVQTPKQYEFIYHAINDELLSPVSIDEIFTNFPPLLFPSENSTIRITSPRTSIRGKLPSSCREEADRPQIQTPLGRLKDQINTQQN